MLCQSCQLVVAGVEQLQSCVGGKVHVEQLLQGAAADVQLLQLWQHREAGSLQLQLLHMRQIPVQQTGQALRVFVCNGDLVSAAQLFKRRTYLCLCSAPCARFWCSACASCQCVEPSHWSAPAGCPARGTQSCASPAPRTTAPTHGAQPSRAARELAKSRTVWHSATFQFDCSIATERSSSSAQALDKNPRRRVNPVSRLAGSRRRILACASWLKSSTRHTHTHTHSRVWARL